MASNHHQWLHRPLIRSSSLPTLSPYESEEELEDDETDDEDDCTEETDGSTPMDEIFRSPLPSFGSAASPTTFNHLLSTDPYPRPLEERETTTSPRVTGNNITGGAYPYTEDYDNVMQC